MTNLRPGPNLPPRQPAMLSHSPAALHPKAARLLFADSPRREPLQLQWLPQLRQPLRPREPQLWPLQAAGSCASKLFLLDALVDHHGQIASGRVDNRRKTLCGGIDKEKQLREELFLARHVRQLANLTNVDNLAVDVS